MLQADVIREHIYSSADQPAAAISQWNPVQMSNTYTCSFI